MPVDTKGRKQVNADFDSVSHPINCLIGFGIVDSGNMTAVALNALLSDQRLKENVQPVCLLGPYFQQCETVEALLRAFLGLKLSKTVDQCLNCHFIATSQSGTGVSHAERLYAGIPTVLFHKAIAIEPFTHELAR